MHTVLELINLSAEYLNKKGIESARLNAELLLSGILKCKRLELYLMFDRPLREDEVTEYRDYIKRRGSFEPLQYILGDVEFWGMNFKVNPSVLIPRQETEILVESIINDAKVCNIKTALDIGTGSGILAVSIAKNIANCSVTALDVSAQALETAKQNAALNEVEAMINFMELDILTENVLPDESFDLIVSNPPYISSEEYKTLQPEIVKYEPEIALTDFNDGYTFYKKISEKGVKLLKSGGHLYFEAGAGQAEDIAELMRALGYKNIKTVKDYLNIERVVTGEKN